MDKICLYFQVHQPHRLQEVSFFELGRNPDYFNDDLNKGILERVVDNCYLPVGKMLQRLSNAFPSFTFNISFSGVVLEQLKMWSPTTLNLFQELVKKGNVEVLGETYFHSLSAFYDKMDFIEQVNKHSVLIKELFGVVPTVFRNTELSYSNAVSHILHENFNFQTILTEGVTFPLKGNSINVVFQSVNRSHTVVLRNNSLSDDLAFRFTDEQWCEYPLTTSKYINWIKKEKGQQVSICMDIETFGEHISKDKGIFDFFEKFISEAYASKFSFQKFSELESDNDQTPTYSVDFPISWADEGKDLSAWAGNSLQRESISKLYNLRSDIFRSGNQDLIEIWRKLTSSDHFYYMSTKSSNDGDVHSYFNPSGSPYNAYIYFMNIISDLKIRLAAKD